MEKPKSPKYIQLASQLEFSRLVSALERVPRVSFMHEHDGKKILAIQMDLLKERPIIYYVPLDKNGHYLAYGFKNGKEETSVVDAVSEPTKLYSPIVKIKELPPSLRQHSDEQLEKYELIELEDLASLAKISHGYEEAPFPLFSFPRGDKWLIGVFMNFNEDGPSYFCHVTLDSEPTQPFLKYSMFNGNAPVFTDNLNEHGYSYIKIIKLVETHPLIHYE
ncbi:hypothetical protein [Candidatus Nitrosotenuis aquarius]|uniref:hypothetical protein n=1 Tax=Candidatus Nitrosotenuis aquarius TaxID=1846278 RepID=UPI000C1F76EC|nr:hypothetical protein [Candidatus Nitrosotenuis aquarius]